MHDDRLAPQAEYYSKIGFSERIGFGARPAILVIDMVRGITEKGGPMYVDMEDAFAPMNAMCDAARRRGIPVIYTRGNITPPHYADKGTFVKKIPLLRASHEDAEITQIDPRIKPAPGEIVITKKYPSGFYGTTMQSLLTFLEVDTTIVVGNSTSGCVRATVVDACSGGFRVIIPRELSADRAPLSHEVNLFDMDAKYGDVMPVADVIAYIEGLDNLTYATSDLAALAV